MARTRSLTLLIADVRARSNFENSEFVSDTEITEWLNQEYAELHGILTMAEGQPHFRSSTNISVLVGTGLYALPSDFLKLQRLTAVLDGQTIDIDNFMEVERASLLNTSIYAFASRGSAPMYRLEADNIEILPSTRAYTATMYYIARSPRMVAGGDTVDGFDGFEMSMVNGATATALEKENPGSGAFYAGQKDRFLLHVKAMAAQRDASHPERVEDVTGGLDMVLGMGGEWWRG